MPPWTRSMRSIARITAKGVAGSTVRCREPAAASTCAGGETSVTLRCSPRVNTSRIGATLAWRGAARTRDGGHRDGDPNGDSEHGSTQHGHAEPRRIQTECRIRKVVADEYLESVDLEGEAW